jgi:hypothetical protein
MAEDVFIVHGQNLFADDVETTLADVPGIEPGRV